MKLFTEQKPGFISVQAETFVIDGQRHQALLVLIQKAQPVRKLFEQGKLKCYSMDGRVGYARKAHCVFCDDRFHCQRKIRLSMILVDNAEHQPVVLDVNHGSFATLEQLVDTIGEEQLKDTPVSLRIVYDDNDRRVIEFTHD